MLKREQLLDKGTCHVGSMALCDIMILTIFNKTDIFLNSKAP